ncbi:MAG: virginiamycin B lyase family protein, partial [Nitrososphaerales archaeon]
MGTAWLMKRRRLRKLSFLLLVLVLLLPSSLATTFVGGGIITSKADSAHVLSLGQVQVTTNPIKEFQVPTNNSGPDGIVAAPNDTFWFSEYTGGKIGEFFAANDTFREFTVPERGANATALAIDRLGRIWFSDQSRTGSIWMFDPSNDNFTQYKTLTKDSKPLFILVDSANNVWFTESTANRLGELSYQNPVMVEYPLPTAQSGPVELSFGQNDSIIWITETFSGKIAEFNTGTHNFIEFTPPPAESLKSPVGIVVDHQGNVWVSDHGGSAVEELIPSNSTFRRFPTSVPPASVGYPISAVATLAIDAKGRLWFVEHFANKVGRLDPSTGSMEEFLIPTQGAYSVQNAVDSKGNFWFTEFEGNEIGMISSNATSPIETYVVPSPSSTVSSGQEVTRNVMITNTLSTPMAVQLNVTSTFSQTGQTTEQEVSLNASSLDLEPGESAGVTATITPDSSLSSGVYSVGIVATYG